MRIELTCKCPRCGTQTAMPMADMAALWADLESDWHIKREVDGGIYLVKDNVAEPIRDLID